VSGRGMWASTTGRRGAMAVSAFRDQKGFTLIELLAVMAIVAVLAVIISIFFS